MKYLFFLFIFISCTEPDKYVCVQTESIQVKLVAFRTAKHSHLWVEVQDDSKYIKEYYSLGGRRVPSVPLGTLSESYWCINEDNSKELVFDKMKFCGSEYVSAPTQFTSLPSYEYLYK